VESPRQAPEDLLGEVRRRRAELRHAMGVLEQALGSPATSRSEQWVARVRSALDEIDADFRMHVAVTEGDNGLYVQVLSDAPRLAGRVRRLTDEHRTLSDMIAQLLDLTEKPADDDAPDVIRDTATQLLARLVRHRQTGSDLLYEAFESDIGGET